MRSVISFVLICMAFEQAYTQINIAETNSNLQTANQGLGLFKTFDNRSKAPNGSSRIFETYLPGGIILNSGEVFQIRQMNYDGYSDAIIVVYNKEERAAATDMVKAFYLVDLTDTLFFYRLLRSDNYLGYYERLWVGDNLTLYKRHSIALESATDSGAYSTGKKQAEFVPNSIFCLQGQRMQASEFKTKKELLKLFPKEKEKLEPYLEANKTDFKNDNDVLALMNYLDSILSRN